MQNRYESQPFQVVRQINNFSSAIRSTMGLQERNDFNNLSSNVCIPEEKKVTDKVERTKMVDKENGVTKFRHSYLDVPIKKIWESDWTLLIPETHKENGSMF